MELLPGLQTALNLHPMFVHFPIVITLLALLSELIHKVSKKAVYGEMTGVLLNLAAISAVVAVITGRLASDSLGHDSPGHDYVHIHRDIMYWFSGLSVLLAGVFQFVKGLRKGFYRLIALFILSGILMVGADRGAQLVYTYGMGVKKDTGQTKQESHAEDNDSVVTEKNRNRNNAHSAHEDH